MLIADDSRTDLINSDTSSYLCLSFPLVCPRTDVNVHFNSLRPNDAYMRQ